MAIPQTPVCQANQLRSAYPTQFSLRFRGHYNAMKCSMQHSVLDFLFHAFKNARLLRIIISSEDVSLRNFFEPCTKVLRGMHEGAPRGKTRENCTRDEKIPFLFRSVGYNSSNPHNTKRQADVQKLPGSPKLPNSLQLYGSGHLFEQQCTQTSYNVGQSQTKSDKPLHVLY